MNNTLTDRCVNKPNLTHALHRASSFRLYPPPIGTEGSTSVFSDVKNAISTRQAAELYGFAVNRNGMMCCPFHGDKHPSMKVDSRFHCFACQADGDVIDFVGRLFQLSPYKAVEKLKEDFGMALADGKVRLAPRRPPTVRHQLLDYYHCLQRWRVRYAPQSPTEELHPCFLEAIKNLDIVEYYLDCSVLPDPQTENELRKYWEGLHERLEKEERRLA